jgi:DNA-binding beta-propeller fold protein YncE
MTFSSRFEVYTDPESIQNISSSSETERFEGVDFSRSGNTLAIATADSNAVLLYQRKVDGHFEDAPYLKLVSGPSYPHDVSFGICRDAELLAVAHRCGAVTVYEMTQGKGKYKPESAVEISGPIAKLDYSDAVAFVHPTNEYFASCNLRSRTISFFRIASVFPISIHLEPEFEIKDASLDSPDGLAFSQCGKWLAVASHGNHAVSIFRRQNKILSGGKLRYGPEPEAIIEDPQLRYPHSVAFTPRGNHLIVTNAGANFFSVYEPPRHYFGTKWSQSPVQRVIVSEEDTFREINSSNEMEGGPKGIAVFGNGIAVCGPKFGVRIFSYRES